MITVGFYLMKLGNRKRVSVLAQIIAVAAHEVSPKTYDVQKIVEDLGSSGAR